MMAIVLDVCRSGGEKGRVESVRSQTGKAEPHITSEISGF